MVFVGVVAVALVELCFVDTFLGPVCVCVHVYATETGHCINSKSLC